jgi:hypothetical protein
VSNIWSTMCAYDGWACLIAVHACRRDVFNPVTEVFSLKFETAMKRRVIKWWAACFLWWVLENSIFMPESKYRSVCVNNVVDDDSLQKFMEISLHYRLDHIRASMYTLTLSTCWLDASNVLSLIPTRGAVVL